MKDLAWWSVAGARVVCCRVHNLTLVTFKKTRSYDPAVATANPPNCLHGVKEPTMC